MKKILFLYIFIFTVLSGHFVYAQDGITLSITPPLIKNTMSPGDIWKSTVKIVNNNPEEMKIYVEAVDFRGKQENGDVEFLATVEKSTSTDTVSPFLSQWIVLENNEIVIPAFGSHDIPFIIDVPDNASPGGHYAAILAGTKPPADNIGGSVIKVSSLLASLVLLNVKGEVEERGIIREFTPDKSIYYYPNINLTVRFENLGNVHLQPQGEIKIYAPFNKLKNTIKINQNSDFGNVLPQSIRRWEFDWKGESNLLEMGRYRAELILGYGEEGRQADNRTVYFWIIYPKPVLLVLAIVIITILFFFIVIRFYIRRAIRNTTGINFSKIQKADKEKLSAKKISIQKPETPQKERDDIIDLKK